MKSISELEDATACGYSYDSYTRAGWRQCLRMLRRRGYDDDAIIEIMLSKWTRWGGDGSDKRYGRYTSSELKRFLDSGDSITPDNWKRRMGL